MTEALVPDKKRKGCFGCSGLFLIFFVVVFVLPFTWQLVMARAEISHLLSTAKTVRVEHYVVARHLDEKASHINSEEVVLASKEIPLAETHLIEDAMPVVPDLGMPLLEKMCLFNPHHRIVITDAAGKVTVIRICFECDHLAIGDENPYHGQLSGMPFVWSFTLRRFFEAEGMPNSPQIYFDAETGRWPETNAPPTTVSPR